MKYKTLFEIKGRTAGNNWVSTGWFGEPAQAQECFLKKYPRFKGMATLTCFNAEDKGNGVLMVSYSDTRMICEIRSAKELKEMVFTSTNTYHECTEKCKSET